MRSAVVEIWQCDGNGVYLHPGSEGGAQRDPNFQGFGRFMTGSTGEYYFRTIKPVPYTLQGQFRAPHIHVAVSKAGKRIMATQALVKGHEANERDLIAQRIKDPKLLETLMVEYRPLPGSALGELAATFDIRLGTTAQELDDGTIGGIGRAPA